MKQLFTGTCLAAALAVGLSAQTPQTPPTAQAPQSPQSPQSAAAPAQDRDAAKTITVSGCLKAGSSSDSFTLSDLKWGSSSPAAPGAAVGTSGSAPAAIASATTLTIKPKGDAKLSEHVGHQVEVTGTVADKDSSSSAASPSKPADPAARPSASASAPTFEARTVKMLAQTCSM